jgi:hypothetical protein
MDVSSRFSCKEWGSEDDLDIPITILHSPLEKMAFPLSVDDQQDDLKWVEISQAAVVPVNGSLFGYCLLNSD